MPTGPDDGELGYDIGPLRVFGAELRAAREARGEGIEPFAERTGLQAPNVSRIETTKNVDPRYSSLAKLAAANGGKIELHFVPDKAAQTKQQQGARRRW